MTNLCSEDGNGLVSLKREGVWRKFATTERETALVATGAKVELASGSLKKVTEERFANNLVDLRHGLQKIVGDIGQRRGDKK